MKVPILAHFGTNDPSIPESVARPLIDQIRADGVATLIVDRDYKMVLSQSERAVVLQSIAHGIAFGFAIVRRRRLRGPRAPPARPTSRPRTHLASPRRHAWSPSRAGRRAKGPRSLPPRRRPVGVSQAARP